MVDEKALAQFVEAGDQLATQVARGPHDQVLELEATKPVAQGGIEHSADLTEPGLSPPDPVADMNGRRETVDQGAVQVEERTDLRSRLRWSYLRDGIGGGEFRHHHDAAHPNRVAVMYCECMKPSIFTSTSGGAMP